MPTFETLYMGGFRKKWRGKAPLSLNATNPQPYTLEELNLLVGADILKMDSDLLLGYNSREGLPELRNALNRYLYPMLNPQNLITTAGGNEAIFISMHALLEKGDKVISFTPTFEPLIKTAQDIGCDVKLLELNEHEGWKLELDKFEALVCDQTKMVIMNFPHNPTGALIDQKTLDRIVTLCRKHEVWLFSDEVFRGLEHSADLQLEPVAEIYEKGISIGVLSKSHGVPSIRVGWIASQSLPFLQRAIEVKNYLSICNGTIGEKIAVPIIESSSKIFENHLDLLVSNLTILEKLKEIYPHFDFCSPKAGCTVFASVNEDSLVFAERLINEQNLMVIPGKAFVTKANAFRLGFSYDDFETRIKGLVKVLDQGRDL